MHPLVSSGSTRNELIYSGPDAGLSLADSIYASKESVLTIQTGAIQKINFTSGIALLALENQFTSIQVITSSITIDHRSKGLYYIDNRPDSTRVYSLTAMLKITIQDVEKAEITSFTLLPSQYFVLDKSINLESMRGVDIFRISQLQTLAIAPIKSQESYQKVFGPQSSNAQKLFEKMRADRTQIQNSLSQLGQYFKEPNSDARVFLQKYGAFFVNDQKKAAIYQSLLAQRLQNLFVLTQKNCVTSCQKEVTALKNIVNEIADLRSSLFALP